MTIAAADVVGCVNGGMMFVSVFRTAGGSARAGARIVARGACAASVA